MKVMEQKRTRICIIGAGPSGMSALYQIKLQGDKGPDFKCYEKQETWNGQWHYNWRTGTDEYGEHVHSAMYRYLWSIGPKELLEFPDYSYKEHFGKLLPSYVPRDIINQYLHGRWTKGKCGDLTPHVDFRHVVRSVEYRNDSDDFVVWVKDLISNEDKMETFSHVIVASGKYTFPHVPHFPGLETFPGRVLHSKDFKDALEFKDKAVLIIGASYSAQDIAIELRKYGAKHVIISVKGSPLGMKFPSRIEERPLLEKTDGKKAYFKDGSEADVDAVMLCTGYMYHYPFLKGDLRFAGQMHTNKFPEHLYKGTVWTKGGNNRLFFMDAFEAFFYFYSLTIQSEWILQYISKSIPNEPVSTEEMSKQIQGQLERASSLQTWKDGIALMKDIMLTFASDINDSTDIVMKINEMVLDCVTDRINDIWTYRDQRFRSMYTGELMPAYHTTWEHALDDSAEEFLK